MMGQAAPEKAGDKARRERAERERTRRILGGPSQPPPSLPTPEWRERYGSW